jgi:Flp pilus assembly protein TadG
MKLSRLVRSDDGASMALVAMSLLLLLGASALAVDLAAMRLDRSADQKVTDSAASAGALAALEGTGQDACETALEYVAVNSEGIGSIDTTGCSSISTTCDPNVPQSHPVSTGRFDVTITYPVDDNNPLMTSAQLGAPTQSVVSDDRDPCDRVGVEMSATHDSLFAQLLGFDQGKTTVHSVAIAFIPEADGPPLNLLVLDRTGCDAIHVRGQGGVIVKKVVNPDTSEEFPGVAAADSDASSGCVPSVLHAEGKSLLRADGPAGCDPTSPGSEEGCGEIQTLAPGTPGCNPPACQIDGSNAIIAPEPTPLADRITRAPVDYAYNCWGDYTNPPAGVWSVADLDPGTGQDIPGCPGTSNPRIYDLIVDVGSSGANGFGLWSDPCNITASDNATFNGDVFVDCADFVIEGNVVINGSVIFEGNVWVKSDGSLTINNSPGWAFFRGGYLRKDGQASLLIDETMLYLSDSSWIEIAGGNFGTLSWIAPNSGTFKDLALWSDSASTHFWAGQGNLTMEGVFFTPWARADYSGTSGQNQTNAQWVAHSLEAHGQGLLEVTPKFEFPVKQPDGARTTLIR